MSADRDRPVHRQREAFLAGEGDAFFARNRTGSGELEARWQRDPVLRALDGLGARPRRVLEVGAGDGWRLAGLGRRHPGAGLFGVEPSAAAARDGRRRFGLPLVRGSAERLAFADDAFDLVILGFFLYLCDREDLFAIAAEVDRVAREDALVAVFDFHAERPYRNPYAHRPGCYSYKMDYAGMFLWNPGYRVLERAVVGHDGPVARGPDDALAVTVLRRRLADAYAEGPPAEATSAEATPRAGKAATPARSRGEPEARRSSGKEASGVQ